MITPSSIAELRDLSIYDVIKSHVILKRAGSGTYVGCCPFHNEKTPSFNVNTVKNYFKCFGCGQGGDGLYFYRTIHKLDFAEAAERLAEQFNITLERDRNFDQAAYELRKQERKSLQQLIDECAARYTAQLWKEPSAGLAYLIEGRGYDEETIRDWGLGFATAESNTLVRHYFTSGTLPQLVKLGLIKAEEGGDDSRHYDFFRNRVLFPIHNERGEVVSFGGRTMGADKPKYLNTATTELYDKSRTIYGLYQAMKGIKELKFATLTEGYTDVISLHRAGLVNAVASCGTALTDEQCILLKRYTDRVLIMRDGDEAGLKATSRDIATLIRQGFAVDVLPMEDGKDPDVFARDFITTEAAEA